MEKFLSISLKLNFTPNILGYYGLNYKVIEVPKTLFVSKTRVLETGCD